MGFPVASFEKLALVSTFKPGDLVKTGSGKVWEFVRVRSNKTFEAYNQNKVLYRVGIEDIVGKVGTTPTTTEAPKPATPDASVSQSWKSLDENEYFFIKYRGRMEIYKFDHFTPTPKIIGINPVTGAKTTIPVGLYGGKLTELA